MKADALSNIDKKTDYLMTLDAVTGAKTSFQETFAEYQMAKNEMWAEYAPRFPNAARWWVDFQSGELHVEVIPNA